MAEDEVRKHTKAALNAMHNPDKNIGEKIKDVSLEIAIIVFAVTISIWFHNLSDKSHERREEKEFLNGLKKDLQTDVENIKSSLGFYQNTLQHMLYFSKVGAGVPLSKDSLRKNAYIFFSTSDLQPHTGRFDGLKGSGKLDIIENTELLNDIMNVHEADLKQIELLDNYYYEYIHRFAEFVGTHAQLDQPGNILNADELLTNSEMRFLLNFGESSIKNNIIPAHKDGLTQCNKLIKEIDIELKK